MMLDPGTINVIDGMLGVLLAALMTSLWVRSGRKVSAFLWMIAAWMLAAASEMFAIRAWLPFAATTFAATIFVTLGLLFILVGVQRFVESAPSWRIGLSIVACHAAGLACILKMDAGVGARMLLNSLFWAGLSSATLVCYRRADTKKWREWYGFPALVFASHAVFHGLRLSILLAHFSGFSLVSVMTLLSLSFAEAGAFSVALFMSLLLSDLRLRNRQLQSALDEVQTLSGLLPICSNCKKIRDDAGYWTKLETYICQHSGAHFSHGLCPDCAMALYPDVFAGKHGAQALHSGSKHGAARTMQADASK
ncbi:MAG: hypothetical protein WC378_03645 [Opitutaceae bacterium]|jgi:hypothetical protein